MAYSVHAGLVETGASYAYSSRHQQTRVGASIPLGLNMRVGLEGKYVKDQISQQAGGFKDLVYSIYVPFLLDFDFVQLDITPFYYFKNGSHKGLLQNSAAAYGVNTQVLVDLVSDDVAERYTQAYVGASYVRQQKSHILEEGTWKEEHYDQLAYTLGVQQNFYNAFTFQAAATAYQYPDGISRVQAFQGIVDQKDLGFTQSYEVNRELGKYVLSARAARIWPQRHASLYIGYHYAEIYTDDPQHSFIVGNSFALLGNIQLDVAFNHLQNTSNRQKRDIFFAACKVTF